MKVQVLNEATLISSSKLKNFVEYIKAVYNWKTNSGDGQEVSRDTKDSLKIIFMYKGTGDEPDNPKGMLVFNPVKEETRNNEIIQTVEWIDVNKKLFDTNYSMAKLGSESWNANDKLKKFPIIDVDFKVDKTNINAKDVGTLYILDNQFREVFFTFRFDVYNN